MKSTNSADFSISAAFPSRTDFARELVELLRCKNHIWVTEQQTDHRVCAWCNYCVGGCSGDMKSSIGSVEGWDREQEI